MAYFFLQCDCILPAVATPGWAEGGDDATDDEDDSHQQDDATLRSRGEREGDILYETSW